MTHQVEETSASAIKALEGIIAGFDKAKIHIITDMDLFLRMSELTDSLEYYHYRLTACTNGSRRVNHEGFDESIDIVAEINYKVKSVMEEIANRVNVVKQTNIGQQYAWP